MLRKGDSIFIGNNSAATQNICWMAASVAQTLGLVPLIHAGVHMATRNGNVDREARDNLYKSKAWVFILSGDERSSISDHWALPELEFREGRPLIIYIKGNPAQRDIKTLKLPIEPVVLTDESQLSADLRTRLKSLISS